MLSALQQNTDIALVWLLKNASNWIREFFLKKLFLAINIFDFFLSIFCNIKIIFQLFLFHFPDHFLELAYLWTFPSLPQSLWNLLTLPNQAYTIRFNFNGLVGLHSMTWLWWTTFFRNRNFYAKLTSSNENLIS